MRSPEQRQQVPPRTVSGKNYEVDLHYLSPGAFTVLPPNDGPPPDPPQAPNPYRLTPTARRHKHQSFAIIGEVGNGSRSGSPTNGRVSPFRGHGFNPSGSRLASPNPSPPPEDIRLTPNQSPSHSRIPQYSRRGSAGAFGDKVSHIQSPPSRRKINSKHSQSLSNLESKRLYNRPPQTPRKNVAFLPNTTPSRSSRLSPIVGSSPEPSQSLSSPSRIPKSRSQPPSRLTSPTRNPKSSTNTLNRTRTNKKTTGKVPGSTTTSRDSSPAQNPTSPTRIPVKRYKNVQSKINSFSYKTQVPPKSQVLSDSDVATSAKRHLKDGAVKIRAQSKLNLLGKASSKNNINNTTKNNNNAKEKTNNNNNNNITAKKPPVDKSKNGTTIKNTESKENLSTPKKKEAVASSGGNNNGNSTSGAESSSKDSPAQFSAPKPVSPMVDGRVLSAMSVSNAINRMNDSAVQSQNLIREHSAKFSPAARAVLTMGSRHNSPVSKLKNAAKGVSSPVANTTPVKTVNSNSNHVTNIGIMDSKALEKEVANNMNKLISPDHIGNSIQKTVQERIRESGPSVEAQPIQITVQEKPSDAEVQSGNVRLSGNASNGVGDRVGIPSENHTGSTEALPPAEEPKKPNACSRFFSSCKDKLSCKCCSKKAPEEPSTKQDEEEAPKKGCFACCPSRKKTASDQVRINIEDEDGPKPTCLDRLKCCGKNRVGDTGCFPTGKRKESWQERRDSILSDPQPPKDKCSKDCCKDVLRTIFCLNLCKKKDEMENISRKTSNVSSNKKKSLTPTSMAPPPEDTRSKLDVSLVEHMSAMKGAIPVLPICLAWFCLVMNCIGPGTGTVFSGLFCLCLGKPRFSQIDGAKQRIGAFIINLIIGFGQFFTVLFCLVGWGWSIWWGVIMLKVSKKYKKIKILEALEESSDKEATPKPKQPPRRDPERGS